jgi:hypothetical protein
VWRVARIVCRPYALIWPNMAFNRTCRGAPANLIVRGRTHGLRNVVLGTDIRSGNCSDGAFTTLHRGAFALFLRGLRVRDAEYSSVAAILWVVAGGSAAFGVAATLVPDWAAPLGRWSIVISRLRHRWSLYSFRCYDAMPPNSSVNADAPVRIFDSASTCGGAPFTLSLSDV